MPAGNVVRQALQLTDAECRLNISHAVVVTELDLLVIPRAIRHLCHFRSIARDAVGSQSRHAVRKPRVIGHRHTTFGSGNELYWVKAEHRNITVTTTANELVPIAATNRV